MLILEGNWVSLNIRASMKDKRDFKFCVILSSNSLNKSWIGCEE